MNKLNNNNNITKTEKLFETYSLDINGNAVNYNTNNKMAVYSGVFLVLSYDENFIKRILYPSDSPIYLVKNVIAKIQNANNSVSNVIKQINNKIPRLGVASFHEDISSLKEGTEVGNNFIDAYGIIFGIAEIKDNYVKCFVSLAENEAIEISFRKDVFGLIQRLNNHTLIGKSEFYKV